MKKLKHPPYKLNLLTATRLSLFQKLHFSSTRVFNPPPCVSKSVPIADAVASRETLTYTYDSSIRFHSLKEEKTKSSVYDVVSSKKSESSNELKTFYAHDHKSISCLHRSKNLLASGGQDGTVCLSRNSNVTRRFRTKAKNISDVRIHPKNDNLITSTSVLGLQVWDASYGACVRALCRSEYTPVTSDFNPRYPTSLLEGSNNGDIVLWDMRSANVSMLIEGAHGACGGGVLDVAYSSTGFLMISGGSDGNMCVWDTRYVKDNSIACLHRETRVHKGYPVRRVKFCGDCSTILVTSSPGDRAVRVWDLGTHSKVESVCEFRAEGRVRALALSPDGRCLFTGTECGKVSSWSLCVE